MSAFSAAASDEDGDIISALREKLGRARALCRIRLDRIRELEAMLYAVGAGGVGKVEQPCQPLTNEQIDKIAEGMPGGIDGFLKGWGWRQFARAVLEAAPLPARQPLTNERIDELPVECALVPDVPIYKTFARAVEAAHKIGGEA